MIWTSHYDSHRFIKCELLLSEASLSMNVDFYNSKGRTKKLRMNYVKDNMARKKVPIEMAVKKMQTHGNC